MNTNNLLIELTLLDYWSISSGLSSGMDADDLVVKKEGLPLLPGRTFKGLMRDAFQSLLQLNHQGFTQEAMDAIFGKTEDQAVKGCFFSDLRLPKTEADEIKAHALEGYLFKALTFTAMEPDQQVKDKSLRKIEFSKPMLLAGEISNLPKLDADAKKLLTTCAAFIKRLGSHRTRGFGRCHFAIKN